eukprot:TRINITY_DN5678_c1_g2_i1.p1 TRINITY_DN5678_c1_g2~~TRINITY_DN5678_c1_g2_i1.p1  ORF type:complete len:412 (-),score=81.70 TRINITY_DN5678_c1_g2_i1:238-1473(-)
MPTRRQRTSIGTEDEQDSKKARGGVAVGDAFPSVELETDESTSDNKKTIDLKAVAEESGLIVFFYPKASTPGCTKQACGFRDNYKDLVNKGYQVFGVSADKPKQQATWKNKQDLPYTLLCDTSFQLMKALGLMKGPRSIKRSHIVVEKGGVISAIEVGVGPQKSVDMVVEKIVGDEEEQEEGVQEDQQEDQQQKAMETEEAQVEVADAKQVVGVNGSQAETEQVQGEKEQQQEDQKPKEVVDSEIVAEVVNAPSTQEKCIEEQKPQSKLTEAMDGQQETVAQISEQQQTAAQVKETEQKETLLQAETEKQQTSPVVETQEPEQADMKSQEPVTATNGTEGIVEKHESVPASTCQEQENVAQNDIAQAQQEGIEEKEKLSADKQTKESEIQGKVISEVQSDQVIGEEIKQSE